MDHLTSTDTEESATSGGTPSLLQVSSCDDITAIASQQSMLKLSSADEKVSSDENTSQNSAIDIANITAIVNYVVKRKRHEWGLLQHEIDDLRQEASVACLEARETFKPGQGATLATWMRQHADWAIHTAIRKLRGSGFTHVARGEYSPDTYGQATAYLAPGQWCAGQEGATDDGFEEEFNDFENVSGEDTRSVDELADILQQMERLERGLKPDMLTLLKLRHGINNTGAPSIGEAELAKLYGVTERTIRRQLRAAETLARGVIERGVR